MEKIIVLDFGGQYNQLIARRVRECSVYCEVKPYNTPISELKELAPIGLIFTGGPNSVYDEASPHVDPLLWLSATGLAPGWVGAAGGGRRRQRVWKDAH